jgi:hypothetical protein
MRPAALLLALLALASCGPLELAGNAAVGTVQLGLGATQAAVGVVDAAF